MKVKHCLQFWITGGIIGIDFDWLIYLRSLMYMYVV